MPRRPAPEPSCLYPAEPELARLVLGDRAREWPAKAVVLEREGLPKVDAMMGGRHYPSVLRFFAARHGLDAAPPVAGMMPARRGPLIALVPDGLETPDAESPAADRRRRRDHRAGRAGA
ncbi:hypothetical protein [Rhodoplanes roseus]|uniref:hypothetical protein n=1 Tax=Rhodoplanes roseus TaxID=29409 RepID=UPI001AECF8BA|nr:hypothetical protein [Rhodoplanes roseus]